MNIDRTVLAFAGVMILLSVTLSQLYSLHWLWVTAFVGANMLQASYTGFCPLAVILRRLGMSPGAGLQIGTELPDP